MTPMVSVLMPCFNAAQWIGAALNSVLSQSYRNLEVIVVDDGSQDGSWTVLQQFVAEPRVKLIRSERNCGQSAACNRAYAAAQGRFIKFFDADDLLSPEFIALQVARLEREPDCVASAEWARFTDDPARAQFRPEPVWCDLPPGEWLIRAWRVGEPMMQCALWLFPRAVLEKSGLWDEKLSLINDFEFVTRALLASSGVRFAQGARLYYRSSVPGALSSRKSRAAAESSFASSMTATANLLKHDSSQAARQSCVNCLAVNAHWMWPRYPDLVGMLERRIDEIGVMPSVSPGGGKIFQAVMRLAGWKFARRLQDAARG